jgi:poly(3-hydroxybutyrate) depolymerase
MVAALAAAFLSAGGTASAHADPALRSLPHVSGGARPGPAVLYAPAPVAPQLENHSPRFRAGPLLVSGTEGYTGGEYRYQDYLYDDSGNGSFAYPTDVARYANNAADLVELRIAPGADSVAYRFTLNSLPVADAAIVSLAFDTDRNAATGKATLPRDPGAPFPGTDEVITTWGTGAEHSRLPTSGAAVTTPVEVHTDLRARQITVVVPRSVSNPRSVWRATLAVGLYDRASHGWLKPGWQATSTQPGGAGASDPAPSGIVNLGFRFDEPVTNTPNASPDTNQAKALQAHDPTHYAHDVDFAALDAHAERSTVPAHGTQVRIFPSRVDLGGGKAPGEFPYERGQLEPYSLYIPSRYRRGTPAGLTLDLHSLGDHYFQYNGSKGVQQIGEGRGNFVLTPEGHGVDGWYRDVGEYDVFEAWNDVARHFTLKGDRVALTGYSMGGYGTYRLGTLWPDLFGRAMTVVGTPGEGIWLPPAAPSGPARGSESTIANTPGYEKLTNVYLENTRNLPFLNVAAGQDELVPYAGPVAQNLGDPADGIRGFDQLGYRFNFVTYSPAEHLTLGGFSYDIPMAPGFLGRARADRNPRHVTFAYAPSADSPLTRSVDGRSLGLVHDHAYWVSGIRLSKPEAPPPPMSEGLLPKCPCSPSYQHYLDRRGDLPQGLVDAFSFGFGRGDPASARTQEAGVGPLPWAAVGREWGAAPAIARRNRLALTLDNVAQVRIDPRRAHLDVRRPIRLDVASSSPARIHLGGVVVRVRPGHHLLSVNVPSRRRR